MPDRVGRTRPERFVAWVDQHQWELLFIGLAPMARLLWDWLR